MDKDKNPQAQAMALLRWSKVSKRDRRAHALKMVEARKVKRAADSPQDEPPDEPA